MPRAGRFTVVLSTILLLHFTQHACGLRWTREPANESYVLLHEPAPLVWLYDLEGDTFESARWGRTVDNIILQRYATQFNASQNVTVFDSHAGNFTWMPPATLVVKNVTTELEGIQLGCQVEEKSGDSIFSSVTLRVIEFRFLDHGPLQVEVIEGDPVELWVLFAVSLSPLANSFVNATFVNDFNRTTVQTNGTTGSLFNFNYTMRISGVGNQHAGSYRPTIVYGDLSIPLLEAKEFVISVRYAPFVTSLTAWPSSGQYSLQGSQVNVTCRSNGYPPPSYAIRNATSLLQNDTTGVYTIASIGFSTEGNFTCLAVNPLGQHVTTLLTVLNGVAPVASTPAVNKTISFSSAYVIACSSLARPPATITWMRGDVNLTNEYTTTTNVISHNNVYNTTSTLTIATPGSDEHMTTFTCRQDNSVGTNQSTSFFYVTYPLTFLPNGRPSNSSIRTGGNVTLICHATVNPGSVIYWWKFNGANISTHQSSLDGNLTLTGLDRTTHDGVYTCVVSSGLDTITADAYLTVMVPPLIRQSSNAETTVTSGSVVTLRCAVTGNPLPTITWKRVESHNVDGSGETYTIDTRGISIGSYSYVCKAINTAGQVEKTFQLTVVPAVPGGVIGNESNWEEWLIPLLVCLCLLLLLLLILLLLRRKTRDKSDSDSESGTQGDDVYVANATYRKHDDHIPTKGAAEEHDLGNDNPMFMNGMGLDDEDEDKMTVNPMYMNEAHGSPSKDGVPKMADGRNAVATRYMVYLPNDDDIQAGHETREAQIELEEEVDSTYMSLKMKALEDYEVEGYESYMSPYDTYAGNRETPPHVPFTPRSASSDVDAYVDNLFDFRAHAD